LPRRGPLRTTACGFRRTGLKQAPPARSARSSSVPQGRPLVRSPPRRRLTCPRVLTLTDVDFGVHLTTSAPFRVRARARIRPVIRDGGGGTSHGCPGFPLPFGHRHSLPGHPVPAGELGLPCGRLTGPCCQGRTPTGLPRSARMSCGRGGCPLYPGDCGARTAGRSSPAAARRLAAARPCTPVQQPTTGGFLSRGIIKGSRSFTRPAFPSPVAPGWNRSPRAFPPGLHTPPLPAAHAGVGTGIVGTCLSYVTISWSSSPRSHSPRATSCRTDLIRACVRHEALSFTDGGERPSISSPSWRWGEAGGSLIRGSPGRAGAASTKSRRFSTAGWAGRGERDGKVYARNRLRYAS
jgi:hypothetical protein